MHVVFNDALPSYLCFFNFVPLVFSISYLGVGIHMSNLPQVLSFF